MVDYVDAPEHNLSPMINSAELPAVLKPNQMLLVKAKASIGAIYKRKREYVISGSVKIFAWLGRHFPGVVHYSFYPL